MDSTDPKNTWERVLGKLEPKINAHSFRTWFRPTALLDDSGTDLKVGVPNGWFAEWIRANYLSAIREALKELGRSEMSVEFVTPTRPRHAPSSASSRPPSPVSREGRPPDRAGSPVGLNPRYTFEKFVVSSCNQFAHAAAMAVTEQPHRAYNPLYIYGGVGLGKTHLMQAIGNRLAAGRPSSLRYISTEQFMNELINAIRFEKTPDFKDRYRNVDVLLIDDIQFLAGKERTQEEFFHTFNALYDAQKQIVITSDCPPRQIPTLEERLRSRFEWGLIADIQPPDLETKIAILRKKAEAENSTLPDDVALFIASHSNSNIRELEGALIRVVAYASMSGKSVGLDLAKDTLRDLIQPDRPTVTIESIQKLVANYYNLRVGELKSRTNSHHVSFPRQIAMYLSKQMTGASFPEIGKRFGGKHHSTVIHAVQKIEKKRTAEKEFNRLMESFVENLQ